MKARLGHALHSAWQKRGLFSVVMRPFSWIYAGVAARRKSRILNRPNGVHHDSLPVVVVGNLYVGGTGKTPVVIALVEALKERGWRPGVVSRGYGSKHSDAPRVGHGDLDPAQFGDEPAQIAAETQVPVAVHPDRKAALSRLRRQYPTVNVIISDDGLQHVALGRDLEIIVQDARGVGNGLVIPAGPLRESPDRLESADFLINNLQQGECASGPAVSAPHVVTMTMSPHTVEHLVSGQTLSWGEWLSLHGRDHCAAAAAIGRPERFFNMLRKHGLDLRTCQALPDHYDFATSPFTAVKAHCILITPKDAIKCRKFADARLYCVHPRPHFSDADWFDLIHRMLRAISDRKHAALRTEALNSDL
jgi:tetraacyldisaccharide 4''-kinase